MKSVLLGITLLATATGALAADKLVNITKLEYGKQWAFTKEEVTLQCRSGGALFVLNNSTLMQYPLNTAAEQQVKKGHQRAQPLEVLLLDDPAEPGKKMSLAPFIERAEKLCAD
ncbi:YebY family protein [Serratia marcescens]|uniref:YebY family protein n=1 Tax=Serratia marcescens TaxID=615 RepID=UPI0013DB7162|nr:YebY family protein [Serratia marcescens]MBI6175279.1 YebY family protein [Serratia marcescens]HBH6891723.1 YebY family protein [Serratia marcescens]